MYHMLRSIAFVHRHKCRLSLSPEDMLIKFYNKLTLDCFQHCQSDQTWSWFERKRGVIDRVNADCELLDTKKVLVALAGFETFFHLIKSTFKSSWKAIPRVGTESTRSLGNFQSSFSPRTKHVKRVKYSWRCHGTVVSIVAPMHLITSCLP